MRRWFSLLIAFVLLASLTGSISAVSVPYSQDASSYTRAVAGSERLVLAFYYAWFDENTWRPDVVSDMPVHPYHSSDRGTIERHVDEAKRAGIDALALSWLGQGNQTDSNLETLLSVAQAKGLRVTFDFETNSPFFHNRGDLVNALSYGIGKYTGHPNFVRHQGKPVIFFWRLRGVPLNPGESALSAWRNIRNQIDPGRSQIWIAEGDDPSFLEVFDGIHMYSIAWSTNINNTMSAFANKVRTREAALGTGKLWAATVMPGYDDYRTGRPDAFARAREDGNYYVSTWNAAMATNPDWIIITSYNEWVEGSQIEPSVTYGDKYLQLTASLSAQFKSMDRAMPAARGVSSTAPDYDICNGHFFTQTGSGGDRASGFRVTNDDGVPFWDEFNRLGGVQGVGYPISRRFNWNGFLVQAMQKGVLQWHPEAGQAYLVNVFDLMHEQGKDGWLLEARSTPPQLGPEFDAGKDWSRVVADRQALLNPFPAIRQRYFAIGSPLTFYGLPTSRVEDMGNHYAVRLQRAVIQQWKVDVPWARAGQVVVANGGDVAKEAGLFPGDVLQPEATP